MDELRSREVAGPDEGKEARQAPVQDEDSQGVSTPASTLAGVSGGKVVETPARREYGEVLDKFWNRTRQVNYHSEQAGLLGKVVVRGVQAEQAKADLVGYHEARAQAALEELSSITNQLKALRESDPSLPQSEWH